jgi:hypothetical protein
LAVNGGSRSFAWCNQLNSETILFHSPTQFGEIDEHASQSLILLTSAIDSGLILRPSRPRSSSRFGSAQEREIYVLQFNASKKRRLF